MELKKAVTQIEKLLVKCAEPDVTGDVKIVVLDRGFVYVGVVKIEGDFLVLRKAKNIRYWGTTKGLGELVNGPTANTKADPAGTVRAPIRSVICLLDTKEGAWKLS